MLVRKKDTLMASDLQSDSNDFIVDKFYEEAPRLPTPQVLLRSLAY
jgi:hypothetical protein